MSTPKGLLFVIVGPPAAGKNALMEATLKREPRVRQLATVTTRPRRPTEQQGRERLFVTLDQFQQMVADNDLLEWQEVHERKYYGVPRRAVEEALAAGQNLIADIDVLGATYIRSLYPSNVILIFVQPPSVDVLEDRMAVRGETEADIQIRLSRVAMEMGYLPLADYVVVNDDFDQAAERFYAIIASEIERQEQQRPVVYTYHHAVTVYPVYEHEVLCRPASPHYPHTALRPAEIPHAAALRVLEETFGLPASVDHLLRIKPNKGSFISPADVRVTTDKTAKQITFTYVYLLPEPVAPPMDWHWQPIEQIELPALVRQILRDSQPLKLNS